MHYEIRGILEENIDWLLELAAETVAGAPRYWNLPDDVKHQILFDCAYQRLMGVDAMWRMIEGHEAEDDHGDVIVEMVNENMDQLVYLLDQYETEFKQDHNSSSNVPTYDVEKTSPE